MVRPKVMVREARVYKREQPVPLLSLAAKALKGQERSAYMRCMLEAGWTQTAIGKAFGVSREYVRQCVSRAKLLESRHWYKYQGKHIPMPLPPEYEVEREVWLPAGAGKPETVARIKELAPIAEKVRGKSQKYRAEANELMALINQAIQEEGATAYAIAKLLGYTHHAIDSRLVRYGYATVAGGKPGDRARSGHKTYAPIKHGVVE